MDEPKVPPSLLLLSRAMLLPEEMSFTDRLKNIFSVLPDTVAEEARLKLSEMEGSKVDNKAKLQMILSIEAALKKERALEKAAKLAAEKAAKLQTEEIERAVEKEEKKIPSVSEQAIGVEPVPSETGAAGETVYAEVEKEKYLLKDKAKVLDVKEIRAVEEVLHEASGELHEEKEDLIELKEQVQEHKEDVEEAIGMVMEVAGDLARESKAAKRLHGKVDKIISRADKVLKRLNEEKKVLREQLVPPEDEEAVQTHSQKMVAVNDLVSSLKRIQKIPTEAKMERIVEVLEALDEDHDGAIDLDLALKVIVLIEEDNVNLKPGQVGKISELLRKEEKAAELAEVMEETHRLEQEEKENILRRDLNSSISFPQPPPLRKLQPSNSGDKSVGDNLSQSSLGGFNSDKSTLPPPVTHEVEEVNKQQSEQRI